MGIIGDSLHLKGALSEAMPLLIRHSPAAKKRLVRLELKHGPAKARSILTARLGRSVYHMLGKGEAFDIDRFLGQG